MKRFLNIVPGDGRCTILLYGYIGDNEGVRPVDVAKELMEAEAAYRKIDVRINSQGGDVMAGIAIFNALRNSGAEITIYIDGVAASMGAVVALCGKPLYMSKYARLMLHGVSGGCWGNREEVERHLETMDGLEETLCAMLSARCGKTPEEIHALFFDGKDHWLKAAEALQLGLIDGTYDADPVPADSTPEQIYQACMSARSGQPKATGIIAQLKARPAFADCVTERDIVGRITGMELEIETYKTREREREEREIFAIVDNAIGENRMNAAQRDAYIGLLRTDRESGEAAIAALPKFQRVMDYINPKGFSNDSRVDKSMWGLAEYRKYAPQELQRNPRLYERLLEDERNREQLRQYQQQ